MTDATLNLNAAECIKAQYRIGETAYHNICSGAVSHVPWGSLDWVVLFGVGALVLVLIAIFGGLGTMLIRDLF